MWTMLNQLPGPDQHNSDLHEQLAHHREIMRYQWSELLSILYSFRIDQWALICEASTPQS